MINELHINNFQSHHDTKLEFHEGLNIIIGQSNSGKSSILRALRLVIENKPSGDSFITKGKKENSVILNIDNNSITRMKGKDNLYILNEKEYKAFGQDVPEEIKQVINFNDINIQKQLDNPFLLSETSGEVAKFFNKVFNLEKIDSSQQQVKSRTTDTKKRISILEEDLKEDEEKLKNFDWIDEAEKSIKALSEQEKELSEMIEQSERLVEIIEDYEKLYDSYITFDDFSYMVDKTEDFINRLEPINELKNEIALINNLSANCMSLNSMLRKEKESLKAAENKLHDIMPEQCPICGQGIKK